MLVGREEALNDFTRNLSDLANGQLSTLTILGTKGIGKTHFIEFVYEILKDNKTKIGIDKLYYVKGKKGFKDYFLKEGIEKSEIINYTKNNPTKKVLIFFDDIDIIFKRYPEKMINIFEICTDCIIGTWDTYAWGNMKTNSEKYRQQMQLKNSKKSKAKNQRKQSQKQ